MYGIPVAPQEMHVEQVYIVDAMLCRCRMGRRRSLHKMCVCKLLKGTDFAVLNTPHMCSSRFEVSTGLPMFSPISPYRNDGLVSIHEALEREVESLPVTVENVEDVLHNRLFASEDSWCWETVALFPDDIFGEMLVEGFQI
jgi:hypothetical protein